MPAITGALGYYQFDYINPIIGVHLVSHGMTDTEVGLFFCIAAFFYMVGTVLIIRLGSKVIEKKTYMITGLLISVVGHLMLGPS